MTQEVCLRFLAGKGFTRLEKPLAYLYRIAAHVLADFLRQSAREAEGLTIDSDVADACLERGGGSIGSSCIERIGVQEEIARALSLLSATHRSVLLAHKHDGFSYEETAARLQLSVHTVEKYISQAKARIRTMALG